MGFVHERAFRLVFEDPDLEGLEVRVRSLNIGQILDIIDPQTKGTSRQQTHQAAQRLADGLIDWNLEYAGGDPVPCTVEGILSQDPALISAINRARLDAVAGVSRPLEPSLSGGGPSAEASIPMDVLSPSPPP